MTAERHRCCNCGKITRNYQRVNGSVWHCYDGRYSTTGRDWRTYDGTPWWLNKEKGIGDWKQ